MSNPKFYPSETNLGKDCMFWDQVRLQCGYPKVELMGRVTCEGCIDDVCLYILIARPPKSMNEEQRRELDARVPDADFSRDLPPGDIE